jgi:proteasome accessory factor C
VLRDHFDGAYGIFSGPAEHEARLRFNAEAARWAADEQWHAEQQAERAADGSLELRFPFGSSRELVMDVSATAPMSRCWRPEFLRRQVADAVDRMRPCYSGIVMNAVTELVGNCHGSVIDAWSN